MRCTALRTVIDQGDAVVGVILAKRFKAVEQIAVFGVENGDDNSQKAMLTNPIQ